MNHLSRSLLAAATISAWAITPMSAQVKSEVFHFYTAGSEAKALKVIVDEFTAQGGIWDDSAVGGSENAYAAVVQRIATGIPPMSVVYSIGEGNGLINQGLMANIDDVISPEQLASVMPTVIVEGITYDGHVMAAPIAVHGNTWVFYSKPVFEKAGITEGPKSWDAFFADMDKIKAAGLIPIAWGGQKWQEVQAFLGVLLSTVGIEQYKKIFIDKDPAAIDSEGMRTAAETFGRFRDYIDAGAPGRNWNDATNMVISGRAGVQFIGDWAKGEFLAANQVAGKDYGCMPGVGNPGLGIIVNTFMFPKQSDAAQTAAQRTLAGIILDPKIQTGFSLLKGSFPARTDASTEGFDACSQIAMALMKEDRVVPYYLQYLGNPDFQGAMEDLVDNYWNDPSMKPNDFVAGFQDAVSSTAQ